MTFRTDPRHELSYIKGLICFDPPKTVSKLVRTELKADLSRIGRRPALTALAVASISCRAAATNFGNH